VHKHQIGTINQRELGVDFDTWSNGLRSAMRQAPKVIVLGELRDRDTLETALNASDSGHLVLATLHTLGAGQTINRITGMFPQDVQPRLRARLADAVQFIVAQWLIPREGAGRIAALEILASNGRTRELIREGETEHKTFYKVLSEGHADGMQTFDQHLVKLYEDGFVTEQTVEHYCTDRVFVSQAVDRIKYERNTGEPEPEDPAMADLKVDFFYGRDKKGRTQRNG
jgi:twitching motility protein PilT